MGKYWHLQDKLGEYRWLYVACGLIVLLFSFQNFSFTNETNADLLLQNTSNGSFVYWKVTGGKYMGGATFPSSTGHDLINYELSSISDLNGDLHPDLLFQHKTGGSIIYWLMQGQQYIGGGPITNINLNLKLWRLAATADINVDGHPDLILQNRNDGSIRYMLMQNARVIGGGEFPRATANSGLFNWELVAATDLDRDGRADFLLQNKVNGAVVFWLMNGIEYRTGSHFSGSGPADGLQHWRLAAAVDINGDEKVDLLWQNRSSGQINYWIMDGLSRTGGGSYIESTNGISPWRVIGGKSASTPKRCDDGWVLIPADRIFTNEDFCMMKFEAQNPHMVDPVEAWNGQDALRDSWAQNAMIDKCPGDNCDHKFQLALRIDGAVPESKYNKNNSLRKPWVYITQIEAMRACSRIPGAHLMTINEVQAVNHNVFAQPKNWVDGVVGSGCLYGGHLDADPYLHVLPAPIQSDDIYFNSYQFTNDTATSTTGTRNSQCYATLQPAYNNVGTNGKLSRRVLYLKDGTPIWDWSGNAAEWVQETCMNSGPNGFNFYRDDHYLGGLPKYVEWTRDYLLDFESTALGPNLPSAPWTAGVDSRNGSGMYFGCELNGMAIYRGGYGHQGPAGGVFQTHMGHSTNYNHSHLGFRCAKVPY